MGIATQSNSTIIFPVKISQTPTVTINILKSYEGVGHALVSVYPEGSTPKEEDWFHVEGLWEKHVSQFEPIFLTTIGHTIQYDPTLGDDHVYLVEVRLQPRDNAKFKIVLV